MDMLALTGDGGGSWGIESPPPLAKAVGGLLATAVGGGADAAEAIAAVGNPATPKLCHDTAAVVAAAVERGDLRVERRGGEGGRDSSFAGRLGRLSSVAARAQDGK